MAKVNLAIDNKILEYIKDYGVKNGCLPTVREIAKDLNITQSMTFYHFKILEDRGKIIRHGQRYSVKGLKYVREEQ